MTFIQEILAAILAVIIAFALGFGIGHFREKSYMTAQAAAVAQKITTASDLKLAAASQVRAAAEAKLQTQITKDQNDYDAKIATLQSTVAQLRLDNVQLHQPPHRESGHSARHRIASAANGSVSARDTSTLSSETTYFLLGFAGDADVVRDRLITCKAYVNQVSIAINQYNADLNKLSGESVKDIQKTFMLPASSSSTP